MLIEQTYIFYRHELLDNRILIDYLKEIDDYDYENYNYSNYKFYKTNNGIFFDRKYLKNDKEYEQKLLLIPEMYLGTFEDEINLLF
jgi:hypothetical protein